MSELPEGWVEAELGELGKWTGGGTPSKSNSTFWENGTVPWVSPKDMKSDRIASSEDKITELAIEGSTTNLVPVGTVMLVTRSGILKHTLPVAIAQVPVTINQDLKALTPSEGINSDFVARQLKGAQRKILNDCSKAGTTVDSIDFKRLQAFRISIPPLAEQKRIVGKLDALSAKSARARDHLSRIETLTKRYKQAVLSKAFSGELTKDWRGAQSAASDSLKEVELVEKAKQGRLKIRGVTKILEGIVLSSLPDGWNWIQNYRLADDASNAICAGPFGTIFKAKDFRSEGVPIVFLRHVGEGKYLTHKPNFMDEEVWKELHQPYSISGGELLVTKLGDPPGTACIYPQEAGTAMVTPDVMKMSVDPSAASTLYLMYFFNSPVCKAMIQELAFGLTRLRIDLSMFKGFPIPLSPRAEQKEIVRRIESAFAKIDKLAADAKRALALTDRLDEAFLAKAFRGELVPQDPNDEPASILLDRIKAERAAAPKAKRGRGKKA
ncbi:restriction endonuclease subunit S [Cohaesibacter marisflavi]|uniref:restriction endonuclease subunit S n=1 Tax=Cohaesibacter marisflavi TaxID=655353 RepID=UPI0029C93CC5|nr:restriction endonuclease subunit S [Cohaesibacter marisflavi]